MTDVELCGAGGCERKARKAGLCWGHYAQKGEPGGFRPLKGEHAPAGDEKLSSLELLQLMARRYSDADVTDDAAYQRALRSLIFAARMKTLRPLTGLSLPRAASVDVKPDGQVVVTFREDIQRALKLQRARKRKEEKR